MLSFWNPDHVQPTGLVDRKTRDNANVWSSQVGQDRTISSLFAAYADDPPFFVDLAANHPLFLSNTRPLERDFGWRGLCVDADEMLAAELVERRACAVAQAIVGSGREKARFKPAPDDGHSAAVKAPDGGTGQITRRLDDLLTQAGAPTRIQYLSLDVEGFEDEVLLTFPLEGWTGWTFEAMTIERPSQKLRSHLRHHRYTYIGDHGWFGDSFWVHESFKGGVARAAEVRNASVKEWGREHCKIMKPFMQSIMTKSGSAGEWARLACSGLI